MTTAEVVKALGVTWRQAIFWAHRFLGPGDDHREWTPQRIAAFRGWLFFRPETGGDQKAAWIADHVSRIVLNASRLDERDVVVVLSDLSILIMPIDSKMFQTVLRVEPVFAAAPVGRWLQEAM